MLTSARIRATGGKLEEAVALCFEDADREGITRGALTDAAGGDVGAHLTRSLTH